MTTEPGTSRQQAATPRPAVTGRPTGSTASPASRPQPSTRVVTVSSPGPLIGAIVTLTLGILLGVSNQSAHDTGMGLRMPALLAALLMVGQGVVDIKRHLPKRRIVEDTDTQLLVDDGSGSGPRATELAVVRNLPPPPPPAAVQATVVRPTPVNLSVPITVMVLAAWLGLADLRVDAPQSLMVLSLIASFALFALGWSLLPARR